MCVWGVYYCVMNCVVVIIGVFCGIGVGFVEVFVCEGICFGFCVCFECLMFFGVVLEMVYCEVFDVIDVEVVEVFG